jgi:hypothetical protein
MTDLSVCGKADFVRNLVIADANLNEALFGLEFEGAPAGGEAKACD